SNNYEFTLINEEYVETTDIVISPTKDNDDPIYNPDLLTQKITKEQTVKPYITVKKKTTTKPTERTRWALKDSPYTYTGRTKRNETKPALQTIVVPAITVYYYEKEIIISHVYISEPNVSVSEAKTEITSVVATTEISSQTSAESTQRYLSKGSKYKAVSVLGGGAAFAVIAVLGVANVNKKSKNEDETKN
ncbi:MAG: hypothetical protein IJ264_02185, partial [Clostridia bacterium]|nr:hypothetical protein [Clostridia bacterium]